MNVISVMNYKGGVGKTTLTANLAAGLALSGKKVLIIDMDAQASLTFSFISPDDWDINYKDKLTIKSWFDAISDSKEPEQLNSYIVSPKRVNDKLKSVTSNSSKTGGRIDLISSHLGLINVDLDLAVLLGGANQKSMKRNYLKVHGQLKKAIRALANSSDYDIVLIDCPPNFNIVTKNAIIASEKILIPAKPDYLSTLGIDYLLGSVKNLQKEFNEWAESDEIFDSTDVQILGVIFTMIQISNGVPISAQRQFIQQIERLGINTFKSNLRENKTIFGDAPQSLIPVILNYYSNSTHAEIVNEMHKLVNEFSKSL